MLYFSYRLREMPQGQIVKERNRKLDVVSMPSARKPKISKTDCHLIKNSP